jgi:hypothetical protein
VRARNDAVGSRSVSMRGETYGKLPTQLSAIVLLRNHRCFYGPTFDVASVKLRMRVY